MQKSAHIFLFHTVLVDAYKRCAQKLICIRADQKFCILQTIFLSRSDIPHCFNDVEHLGYCEMCNASLISDYYCCLPKSTFRCPLQQCLDNQSLVVEEFDLNASMILAFAILKTGFRWSRFFWFEIKNL